LTPIVNIIFLNLYWTIFYSIRTDTCSFWGW